MEFQVGFDSRHQPLHVLYDTTSNSRSSMTWVYSWIGRTLLCRSWKISSASTPRIVQRSSEVPICIPSEEPFHTPHSQLIQDIVACAIPSKLLTSFKLGHKFNCLAYDATKVTLILQIRGNHDQVRQLVINSRFLEVVLMLNKKLTISIATRDPLYVLVKEHLDKGHVELFLPPSTCIQCIWLSSLLGTIHLSFVTL